MSCKPTETILAPRRWALAAAWIRSAQQFRGRQAAVGHDLVHVHAHEIAHHLARAPGPAAGPSRPRCCKPSPEVGDLELHGYAHGQQADRRRVCRRLLSLVSTVDRARGWPPGNCPPSCGSPSRARPLLFAGLRLGHVTRHRTFESARCGSDRPCRWARASFRCAPGPSSVAVLRPACRNAPATPARPRSMNTTQVDSTSTATCSNSSHPSAFSKKR